MDVSYRRRLLAYLVDILPITFLVTTVYYFAFGFDQAWERYRVSGRHGPDAAVFRAFQGEIRDISSLLYLVYASVLESSSFQSTLGKRLLGLIVVNELGTRIRFRTALKRNCFKILSAIPCLLYCLANLRSSKRRAWHDVVASTHVVPIPVRPDNGQ